MHSNCEGDSGGPALMMLDGKRAHRRHHAGRLSSSCPVTCSPHNDTRVDAYASSFVDGYVNQFDPPAVAPGGACATDADCGTLPCLNTGSGETCAPPCDPSDASSMCPAGLTCTTSTTSRCAPRDITAATWAAPTPTRRARPLLRRRAPTTPSPPRRLVLEIFEDDRPASHLVAMRELMAAHVFAIDKELFSLERQDPVLAVLVEDRSRRRGYLRSPAPALRAAWRRWARRRCRRAPCARRAARRG